MCTQFEKVTLYDFYHQKMITNTTIYTSTNIPKQAKADTKSSPVKLPSSRYLSSQRVPATVFPKSVSISDLLKAGRLIKPPKTYT